MELGEIGAGVQKTVLLVEDSAENIDIIRLILEPDYRVRVATSGERALEISNSTKPPNIILLDVLLPGISGLETCRQLKLNKRTKDIPVLFITSKDAAEDESRGFEVGCVDYITKPVSAPVVRARVHTHLSLHEKNHALREAIHRRTRELEETRLEIIHRLGFAAEYKDKETGAHIVRMSQYAHLIAIGLGLGERQSELILHSFPMHDIGKIGVPDSILTKEGPLDNNEWEIMKTHTTIGFQIIGKHHSDLLAMAATTALTHHEKWDGTGYPSGLKEIDIPLVGRIAAVADVFDALTSKRPYKAVWPTEIAVEHIKLESKRHFDPRIVEVFFECLPDIIKIMEANRD